MSTCARRRTKWDHLIDNTWVPILAIIAIVVFFGWLYCRESNTLVVEESHSTGQSWEVKPDGTKVPFDPSTNKTTFEHYWVK